MALARVNVSSGGRTPPITVNVPTQSGTLTYSGSVKTPTWNGYDATQLLIGGTTSATDAGTYTATFTPQGNVTWSDGTSSPKSVTWTIAKATPVLTLSKTSISVGLDSTTTFTVTSPSNGALSVTSSSTDVATVTISGTTATVAGKGAGNATITVSQAAGTNYNAASATCAVSVARASLNLSANISGAVTYNTTGTISISGNAGNGAITATSSDTNVIAVTNTSTNSVTVKAISGTGNATITISVAATANYAADSTTCVVNAAKATPTLTLSKTSGQVSKDETVTFTATSPSDGALSVTSSNSNVATATVSGQTVTVTGVGVGDATITVSQAATANYTAKTATFAATITAVSLITDDWATISSRAKAGTAANYYKVGDCKEITLNGKIGDYCELNNEKLYVFILHINYPMNGTSDNNIIWGGFKNADGTEVVLVDNPTLDEWHIDSRGVCFTPNHWCNNNYGGWKGTDFRYDILGACSAGPSDYGKEHTENCVGYDASSATILTPKTNTLLAALPEDFRKNLRVWSRWIDAKGGGANTEDAIKETKDAVSLLAEFEVFGKQEQGCSNECEQNHQTQMDYYRLRGNSLKYSYKNATEAQRWWLATPESDRHNTILSVPYRGYGTLLYGDKNRPTVSYGGSNANPNFGIAPAFKM